MTKPPSGGSGGGGLPVDSSLLFKLVRVVNLTARPFQETIARQHRLSLNEWRVMVVLASHAGGAVATDVVEATGLDKMAVSRALAALEKEGRLLRAGDPADQRRSHLRLSAAGRRLFAKLGTQARLREAGLFSGVKAAELARLDATLDKLIAGLLRTDDGDGGAAPGDG